LEVKSERNGNLRVNSITKAFLDELSSVTGIPVMG
jgi:hypothetical protein